MQVYSFFFFFFFWAATSAAAKHMNNSLVNQAIAALYLHPQLHDHVVGWAPVRSGQLNAEVHLSFKDTSAQHRQQIASAGAIQVTMHGAAAPISLPVSTVFFFFFFFFWVTG
ncbi:hypothetical protein ABBQ38_001690 [Trebouxia sp. C0009 RCD-2024]